MSEPPAVQAARADVKHASHMLKLAREAYKTANAGTDAEAARGARRAVTHRLNKLGAAEDALKRALKNNR